MKQNWILRLKQLTIHQLLYANKRWTSFTCDQNGYLSPNEASLKDLTNEQIEEDICAVLSLQSKKVSAIRAELVSPLSEILLSTVHTNIDKVNRNPVFIACLNFAENALQPVYRTPTFAPFAAANPLQILSSQPNDAYDTSESDEEEEEEQQDDDQQ